MATVATLHPQLAEMQESPVGRIGALMAAMKSVKELDAQLAGNGGAQRAMHNLLRSMTVMLPGDVRAATLAILDESPTIEKAVEQALQAPSVAGFIQKQQNRSVVVPEPEAVLEALAAMGGVPHECKACGYVSMIGKTE